VNRRR